MFSYLKPGDDVTRMLAGLIAMPLTVSKVTDKTIVCQPFGYVFDIKTGAEIDIELGWGINGTGSYLKKKESDHATNNRDSKKQPY